MPLGLNNAPRIFKIHISSVFWEALDHFFTVYLDNTLIYSFSTLEHLQYSKWILSKCRSNSDFPKPTKCKFDPSKLEYLGKIISSGIVKPDPKKTVAIKQLASTNTIEFQVYVGFCNYYSHFVRCYAKISAPLYDLFCKEAT